MSTTRCCGVRGSVHYILYGLQHCNYKSVIRQPPNRKNRMGDSGEVIHSLWQDLEKKLRGPAIC